MRWLRNLIIVLLIGGFFGINMDNVNTFCFWLSDSPIICTKIFGENEVDEDIEYCDEYDVKEGECKDENIEA